MQFNIQGPITNSEKFTFRKPLPKFVFLSTIDSKNARVYEKGGIDGVSIFSAIVVEAFLVQFGAKSCVSEDDYLSDSYA